jgi:glycosidase
LYLNPINHAFTNHKYDPLDHLEISPEFGTHEDLDRLLHETHARGMRLVLDGVFNHMGRNAPIFRNALAAEDGPYRNWFVFGSQYPGGARVWFGAENLPELNLEHQRVREYVYAAHNSVVRSYVRRGIDGWRLDVASDVGFDVLRAITQAAHDENPESLVVGETWNYPKEWLSHVDGTISFTLREIILCTLQQRIAPLAANAMIERLIVDSGIEPLLKSWLLLENHDTPRLATVVPELRQRRLAQLLQFTLPGSPALYYGSELGMTGGNDPEMRAPMRWDLVQADQPDLAWTRRLVALRRRHRALRIGDFRRIESANLIAFERYTDRVQDTVIILMNPAERAVTDTVLIANSRLMNTAPLTDILSDTRHSRLMNAGLLEVSLAPRDFLLLSPNVEPLCGYTPYKRVP